MAMFLFSVSVSDSALWRKSDLDAGLALWWLHALNSSISSFLRTDRGVICRMDRSRPSCVTSSERSPSITSSICLPTFSSCRLLKVVTTASFTACSISAPVKPWLFCESSFTSRRERFCTLLSRCILNISSLSSWLGRSTKKTSS